MMTKGDSCHPVIRSANDVAIDECISDYRAIFLDLICLFPFDVRDINLIVSEIYFANLQTPTPALLLKRPKGQPLITKAFIKVHLVRKFATWDTVDKN